MSFYRSSRWAFPLRIFLELSQFTLAAQGYSIEQANQLDSLQQGRLESYCWYMIKVQQSQTCTIPVPHGKIDFYSGQNLLEGKLHKIAPAN